MQLEFMRAWHCIWHGSGKIKLKEVLQPTTCNNVNFPLRVSTQIKRLLKHIYTNYVSPCPLMFTLIALPCILSLKN
jgi:hypothetical protein